MKKRKNGYLGYILRGTRYNFQLLILQGNIEGGKRGVGEGDYLAAKHTTVNRNTALPDTVECCNNRIIQEEG